MSSNTITPLSIAPVRALEPRPANREAAPAPDPAQRGLQLGKPLPAAGLRQPSDPEKLADAVTELNEYVQNVQRDLEFSIDEDSGRTIIKVIDSKSKEVIRQIPPEEVLNIARNLERALDGTILEVKA